MAGAVCLMASLWSTLGLPWCGESIFLTKPLLASERWVRSTKEFLLTFTLTIYLTFLGRLRLSGPALEDAHIHTCAQTHTPGLLPFLVCTR